jgi:hypothetical protein
MERTRGLVELAPFVGVATSLLIAACAGTDKTSAAPEQAAAAPASVAPAAPVAPQATTPSASAAPVTTTQPAAGAAAPTAQPAPSTTVATPPTTMQPTAATPTATATPTASVAIKVPQVAPGAEDTQCVQIKLSNTEPVDIVKLHNKLSAGSHHFILTALNDQAAPEQNLTRCQGFGGAVTGAPLTITQAHDDQVALPEGLGYRLNPGHVLHLEMHYINTTDAPIDIEATSDLFAGAAGSQLQPAAVMLIGTADINVPPRSMMETGPKFLKLPAGMDDVKFFAITGHTHAHGTNVHVALASPEQTPVMDLYAPKVFDWEAPESTALTPHVSVPKDGGFLLQCAWNNTSDTELTWGESARQEMCFFWGYYYPRKDVFSIVIDDIDQSILKRIASMPPEPAP